MNTGDTSLTVTVPNTVRNVTYKSELSVNIVESPAYTSIYRYLPAAVRAHLFILQPVPFIIHLFRNITGEFLGIFQHVELNSVPYRTIRLNSERPQMMFAIIKSHCETSRHDTVSELPALGSTDW